jgi:NAD(P) transhydrogenase subunit alpha
MTALLTALGAAAAFIAATTSDAAATATASTLVDGQIVEIYVFLLAAFTGFQIITKVPPLLHTPLMAATNAISAISLVASIVIAGAERPLFINIMGMVAVAAATINVVGGFVITDRMLKMFKKTEAPK